MKQHTQAICAVSTLDYLPKLIVMYDSVLQFHRIPLYLMVVDANPDELGPLAQTLQQFLPAGAADLVQLIAPAAVYGAATMHMRFYYDAFEFATACKAGVHAWMQRHTHIDRWLFLDSDMLCCGPLDPILDALEGYSILLTPHLSKPSVSFATDMQILSAGAFNGGVLGVRRSPTSQAFTDWYLKTLYFGCLNDPQLQPQDRLTQSTVIFADQRWLDLVPAYFPDVVISRNRGFNLGHWNVEADRLRRHGDALYLGEDKVTLLHLSGWAEASPHLLSKHSPLDWAGDSVWAEVHRRYANALAPLRAHFDRPYRYGTYADGSAIPAKHRRRYLRHLLSGADAVDNPFLIRRALESALENEAGH